MTRQQTCFVVACLLVFSFSLPDILPFAERQLTHTAEITPRNFYPSATNPTGPNIGLWRNSKSDGWTSGFFAGCLWHMYALTTDTKWKNLAIEWQSGLAVEQNNTKTHDVGFMLYDSFGIGYQLIKDEAWRKILLTTAHSLSTRFSPTVGCIKSWNWKPTDFPVIIDNMMNLELLYWAAKNGGESSWYEMAVSHASKTAANHIRTDGSSFHVVDYDPSSGSVLWKGTAQGYSNSSTWARGQTWAIYGMSISYRETGNELFLYTAQRAADFFIDHLPKDYVPYWDFNAPGIPDAPRDSSAASIAASGFLELSELVPAALKPKYRGVAEKILESLLTYYTAQSSPNYVSILMHGTVFWKNHDFDTGIIYGDYYLLEALRKLKR
jgi:hypothetical protein